MSVTMTAQVKFVQLGQERARLQSQINETYTEGSDWIEKVIRSFELLKMAEEMLNYGSPNVREAVLKAIASNYSVTDGKLVPELQSPFKEAFSKNEDKEWWAILDLNQ